MEIFEPDIPPVRNFSIHYQIINLRIPPRRDFKIENLLMTTVLA